MPYLGSTLFVVTLVAALLLALTAYWLLVRALAPRFVERSRERWRRRPILTTLLGGVIGGLGTGVGLLLMSLDVGVAKLAGAGMITALLAVALAGAAGLAARVGEGLASPSDDGREWFQTLKGGAVLELSFLLPFFGWLVLMPLAIYGGFGAALSAAVQGLVERGVSRSETEASETLRARSA
ncbi:MAG TPA: hypothetical protein RMH99_24150 [Sandaracinaceae bacterium LLY-WYZ-13_1]|nr:hypothetical protein [Sandaracinaceae bacterium LLY-WYZ-13_1]